MTPIRLSAKGEECDLKTKYCNGNTETTVWCHANDYQSGKGLGLKARDEEGCYGCSACHAFIDGGYAYLGYTREQRDEIFNAARIRSREKLVCKKLAE